MLIDIGRDPRFHRLRRHHDTIGADALALMDDGVDADHQPIGLFREGPDHPIPGDRPRIGLHHHRAAGI